MTQSMVRLAPGELALWLGLPIEDMRATIRSRAQEGRWRILSGDASPGAERVELPAADLNAELDARHGGLRKDPCEPAAHDGHLGRLEAELERARQRNHELNRLLLQASHALEGARSRPHEPAPPEQPHEPAPEQPRAALPSDELIEAKRALIAAYDKILDLQKQVYASGEEVAAAREESAAVDTIHTILDRVKARRKNS